VCAYSFFYCFLAGEARGARFDASYKIEDLAFDVFCCRRVRDGEKMNETFRHPFT
jgi:hypothetical protein